MGQAIKRVFSGRYQPLTLRVMVMWIGYWVAWWGWSIFVPHYLVEAAGVKPPQVLFTMGCFAFAAFLVQLSVGWFCDLLGRKATIVAFSILAIAFAWWWSLAPGGPAGVWIGGAAFALMLGPPGALVAYTSELFPTALRGTGQSVTMGVARLVSIAAPGLGGFIAARLSQGVEMRIVTGFLVITILATLFGAETKAVELEDYPEQDLAPVAAVPARAI
jgi:putative MFS transporter